ncbi:MAG: hypothetical protein AWM53_00229 [Candidatus Dichloromethanomonas elyunquensis]|nr:MAG: hypothetical protein AWM53_00229 [Candidatus Dichloromethanomonas elyunquensis]
MVAVNGSFQSELYGMEVLMNEEIRFRSFRLEDLLDLRMNSLDKYLCPSVVLAVGSMMGKNSQKMINLASILQYVFLAHYIQAQVTENNPTEHIRQYPVLVGDFMFGQIYLKLCKPDLFPYSGQFVKLIKTINEGIILRWKLKNKNIPLKDYRMVIGKEKASLTAVAAKTAAEFSGFQEQHLKKLEEFGYNLGMAWAAWEESVYTALVQEYLIKAKIIIAELKDQLYTKPLQELYEFFYQEININTSAITIGI